MGAWGTGLFENDTALNYVSSFFINMVCELRQNLDEEYLDGSDMTDAVKVQVYFLATVAQAYPNHDLFTKANVEDWKTRAVTIYRNTRHRYIDVTEEGTEAEVGRIEEIFDELSLYVAVPDADISDDDFEATYEWWKSRNCESESNG